jgi:hypothetical protein
MANTDISYTARNKILKAQILFNFHLQNLTKQLEGPCGITPSSVLTEMKLYQGCASKTALDAPTNVVATASLSLSTVVVSWTAPTYTTGYEITSYTVYIWFTNLVDGTLYGSPISGISSSVTSITTPVLGTIIGKSIQFSVTATNSIGESAQSIKSSSVTVGCLIGTTLIELADGSFVELQKIQTNDILASFDLDTKQKCSVVVLGLVSFTYSVMSINNGLLVCTDTHTHYVKRDGIWSIQTKVYVGDYFLDVNMNEIEIISIVNEPKPVVVYNLEVSGNHLYYANGILTHNGK